MPLIEVRSLEKRYGGLAALRAVSFDIERGEWISVMGPSGSGKTTLVNLLAGLDAPTEGEVRFEGRDLARLSPAELAVHRRENVGLVFQHHHLIPYLTALENVMLAQYLHSLPDEEEARRALEEVGLAERAAHFPGALSGGEQQRVCVARALINQPKLILADEPTGNLDAANAAHVLGLLTRLHNAGHTIVVVTHDPEVGRLASRRLELHHGDLRAERRSTREEEELFDDVLQQFWERREAGGGGNECADATPHMLDNRSVLLAMRGRGILREEEGAFALTETGERRARDIVRRHRLAECLFRETLSIRNNEQIESNACVLEHVLSPEVTESICRFLGHPRGCPHGRPVPRGACCEEGGEGAGPSAGAI
ncbi:MAG TPA: ATP-binding cassette domain-containing protein [Planctomycetota bacterium]|jgi:putative ABC transport system ATP-binding protein|nr:ATP-binding cassette domain-containing protein [Planctomycetota bacterium]